MGAGTRALATLKVAVGAGDDPFLLTEGFTAGIETHGAAGFAPLETGLYENLVQPLGFSGLLDRGGAGNHHCGNAIGHLAARWPAFRAW